MLLIQINDWFAIRFGRELAVLKFRSKLLVVPDFTIDGECDSSIFIVERLSSISGIDDGETLMNENIETLSFGCIALLNADTGSVFFSVSLLCRKHQSSLSNFRRFSLRTKDGENSTHVESDDKIEMDLKNKTNLPTIIR